MDSPTTNAVNGGGRGSGKFNEMALAIGEKLNNVEVESVTIAGMTEEQSIRFAQQIFQEFGFHPNREPEIGVSQNVTYMGIFTVYTNETHKIGYTFSKPRPLTCVQKGD